MIRFIFRRPSSVLIKALFATLAILLISNSSFAAKKSLDSMVYCDCYSGPGDWWDSYQILLVKLNYSTGAETVIKLIKAADEYPVFTNKWWGENSKKNLEYTRSECRKVIKNYSQCQ